MMYGRERLDDKRAEGVVTSPLKRDIKNSPLIIHLALKTDNNPPDHSPCPRVHRLKCALESLF